MHLKNSVGIETSHGYRTFELWHGDLLEPEAAADLLVTSAFALAYQPVPGTVFGALHQAWGLDFRTVRPALDLRSALSIWISEPLTSGHFGRLLCVELVGGELRLEEAIANVFVGVAVLEAKGIAIRSVALPLLGSGNQRLEPREVVTVLVPEARRALERLASLERVLFVERDEARVALLDEAVDGHLGRVRVRLPKKQLHAHLLEDIREVIAALALRSSEDQRRTLSDVRDLLHEEARAIEIGIAARRVAEMVVAGVVGSGSRGKDLAKRIEHAASAGVAPWIRSYLHTLRLFGNESAHVKSVEKRQPAHLDEEDLAVCLFCIQRVLVFWRDRARDQASP